MALFSFNTLVLLVVSIAAYYAYAVYIKLEYAQRAKHFALDQRRRAGIPDTDARPFGIARADALKKRQESQDAAAHRPRPSPFKSNGAAAAAASPISSPRLFVRSSPTKHQTSIDSTLAQSGYLRHRSSGNLRTHADVKPEPRWPGAFRYDDDSATAVQQRLYPTRDFSAASPREEKAITWSSLTTRKHGLSDTDSMTGSVDASQSKKKSQKIDQENLERRAITARTSKKRGPSEVRDGVDDSVSGDRTVKRRTRAAPLQELSGDDYDSIDYEEEDDDEDHDMADASPPPAQQGRRGKKRDVDQVDGAESTAGASTRIIQSKKRGKASKSTPSDQPTLSDREYQLEDEEMASLDDFGADRIETDRESLALAGSRPRPSNGKGKGKRKVDTSDDREPGDEWTDLNGLRWQIGEDGVRRRATVVVEMRPKYNMPKDSQHPDAKQKIQVYVERFLSEREYEEARKKKLLGFQEAERQREAEAKQKAAEEAAAKVAEDATAGRNVSTPRKLRNNDLLYSDSIVRHQSPLRAARSEVNSQRPVGTPPPRSDSIPLRDGTPGSAAKVNKRISLSVSNSAGTSLTTSPAARSLTPSRRSGLDEESKRRREEALLKKLREAQEAKEAASQPKPSPAPQAAPVPAAASLSAAHAASAAADTTGTAAPAATADASAPTSATSLFAGLASAKKADTPATQNEVKFSLTSGFSSGGLSSTSSTAAPVKAAETKPTSVPSFSFGSPAAATPAAPAAAATKPEDKPKSLGSFSFGTPASPAPTTAASSEMKPAASTGGFTFGTAASQPKTESAAPAGSTAPATFTFGSGSGGGNGSTPAPTTSAPATSASTSTFSFGAPKTSDTKPASSSSTFTFGASTPAAASASSTPAAPSFSFGAPPAASNGDSNPASGSTSTFGSTLAAAPASTGSGGFTFGAPASNDSGAPAAGGFTFSIGKKRGGE